MIDIITESQTALKNWETGCRRKWKGMWIDKTIPFYSNPKMDYGKYFEYHCIGGGSNADEEVTDLPRKKNGDKYAHHIRIDEQIIRFKELFNPKHIDYLGYKIIDTQAVVFSEDKRMRGVKDMVCFNEFTGKIATLDLKLTSDVDLTMHPSFWGHSDSELDTTQAEYYSNIDFSITNECPEFSYLVFDYSPRKQIKKVEVTIDPSAGELRPIRERINNFREEVYSGAEFTEIPSDRECENCPLKCGSRIKEFKHEEL